MGEIQPSPVEFQGSESGLSLHNPRTDEGLSLQLPGLSPDLPLKMGPEHPSTSSPAGLSLSIVRLSKEQSLLTQGLAGFSQLEVSLRPAASGLLPQYWEKPDVRFLKNCLIPAPVLRHSRRCAFTQK